MHILFFSHYYPPEVNAPASRTSEHCRAWVAAGHRVTVVTCAPNHPAGILYPGYRNRLLHREVVDGVEVVRLWTYLAANEGFARRILNYVSYLVATALALPALPRPDVIVSTSPQFFCGLAGLVAGIVKRRAWVFEVRDLWPESIVTVGAMRKGPAIRVLEAIERLAYRRADAIVSLTRSFVPHVVAAGADPARVVVIPNGADLSLFRPGGDSAPAKGALGLDGRFVAAYVGTHGMAQGLDTILDAAEILAGDRRIAFLLVGDGAERARLVAERDRRGLANVHILPQRPKADMPAVWAATDASLILLRRSPLFTKVLPSKMPEAMAMGCPVILGVEGEARDVLLASCGGFAVPPQDATALADAVRRLADDPALARRLGERGRAYVEAHFDRAVLARRLLDVLVAVAAGRPLPNAGSAAWLA